ncbi:hypothetical protein IB286_10210 [Spongiibacter sp. KMU-158]|uniref:PhoP regulatory network protein YrbL n=1 Tax=Spongiibacter pelagi TaxID=2760804 RepID=A0A927C3X3_9GAMM|nr:YrbL family protein [Spongiibacter pelagi]MBD2859377.1 hypothetical protein [Spongiibacter pelagi]
MIYTLQSEQAFSSGGNRLCYVLPGQPERCVKVLKRERAPEIRRAEKSFPKNLRALSTFDENWQEWKEFQLMQKRFPDAIFAHISRVYGFVETDLGSGLCSELIRNHDGSVAMSLQLYLWENGYTESCRAAVKTLADHWLKYGIPSRDLLVHNIVAQCLNPAVPNEVSRLVVIDGLGGTGLAAIPFLPLCAKRYFASRKVENLHQRIDYFLQHIKSGEYLGFNGLPMKDGVTQVPEKRSAGPDQKQTPQV